MTWNPVFGIEDLGLRIWDLDSSWPTDPFDQLDVPQLSMIFFFFHALYAKEGDFLYTTIPQLEDMPLPGFGVKCEDQI